jgi:NADH-quinone oxidoreductase subunit J
MLAIAVIVCWAVLRAQPGEVYLGVVRDPSKAFGNAAAIADLLFHQFLLPFEVTSILVLIAIMGAVVLAARPESVQESRRES